MFYILMFTFTNRYTYILFAGAVVGPRASCVAEC